MNLKQLHQIATIARTGNFSRAAEELGIPQPVLSRSIKTMEARFGVALFDRGRFGARLTERGHSIMGEINDILERCATLESGLLGSGSKEVERIAIGASPLPAAILLPKVVAAAIASEPRLKVDMQVLATEPLVDLLSQGAIAFALCLEHNVPTVPDIRIDRIGTVQTGCIVRKGHPLLSRSEVTISDIARYPTVGSPTATRAYQAEISCNDHQVQKQIAANSDAIWFASPLLLEKNDRLMELALAGPPLEPRHIAVISQTARMIPPGAQALLGRLRDAAARM